jgi:O-antigen ligase
MDKLTFLALFTFAIGILTSVTIPAGLHIFGSISGIYYLSKRKHLIKGLPLSAYALLLFCLSWIISTLVNFSSINAFGKSFGSIKYWLFSIVFMFPLAAYFKQDRTKQIRLLLNILLSTIILSLVVGILRSKFHFDPVKFQSKWFHPRLGGFYEFMRYAYNVQFWLIIMSGLLLFREQLKKYFSLPLLLVALASGWIGLILSETRGALLATLAGLLVLLLIKNKKMGIYFGAALIALLVASLAIVFSGGSEKIRILEKYNSSSNTIRVSQFQAAIAATRENPILGLGPNQFRFNVEDIKKRYELQHQDYIGQHAHNIYLEVMANFGMVGITLFLAWLFLWGKELISGQNMILKALLLPCFVAILVSGMVEYLFNSTGSFTIFLFYSISGANYLLKRESSYNI